MAKIRYKVCRTVQGGKGALRCEPTQFHNKQAARTAAVTLSKDARKRGIYDSVVIARVRAGKRRDIVSGCSPRGCTDFKASGYESRNSFFGVKRKKRARKKRRTR